MGTSTSKSKVHLSRDRIKTYLLGGIEVLDEYSEIDCKLKFCCQGELCIEYNSISNNIDHFMNIFINQLACDTHMKPDHLIYSKSNKYNAHNINESAGYFHYLFRKHWIESQVIPKILILKKSAILSFVFIHFSELMNEDMAKKIFNMYKQIKFYKKKKNSFFSYFS